MEKIIQTLAQIVRVSEAQVRSAVKLLDEGATVPFIARYRKEATGGLDDTQLRELAYQLGYQREMEERRATILKSIGEQGKLSDALAAQIAMATSKQELEDLYLPYKPKRRTKAMMAREAGLEALADALLADPKLMPLDAAAAYVKPAGTPEGTDFSSPQLALDGARDILAERWAEDAALVQSLREWLWADAHLVSTLAAGKDAAQADAAKFRDYFEYSEPFRTIPSHRALAVFRGRQAEVLDAKLSISKPIFGEKEQHVGVSGTSVATNSVAIMLSDLAKQDSALAEGRIAIHLGWSSTGRAADDWLRKTIGWTWRVKLSLSLERDLFARLREAAEKTAIEVFAANLRDVLLAAPAGAAATMGLDPGIRTGVKVAVVDATGKVLDTATVYPHEPKRDWDGALHTLRILVERHGVRRLAIGNGTASRETDQLAADLMKMLPEAGLQKVVVSEAGASVYSASEYASQELPELDVSLRGAVSIARRLQDPLAELVKIEPKSIGVGQYQHDVNPTELARSLDAVVEDCVNAVGVDLNTASVPLLSRVSGLSGSTAKAIVRWRESHGAFASRKQLLDVSGLGAKTFEQCAGFLRIRDGDEPLDATSVHPESYAVAQAVIAHTRKTVREVMGQSDLLRGLKPALFVTEKVGEPTVRDILAELEKPARDPRGEFKVARFNEGLNDIKDLQPGMILEGTVSNVAAFGAFVDLGVHQDGLIHVSQLAHKFVNDAREVVKTGQVVRVKVMEVDVARKRIGLSMKLEAAPPRNDSSRGRPRDDPRSFPKHPRSAAQGNSAMTDALAKLRR